MSSSPAVTVADVLQALEKRFPGAWAEDWDNVGLILGEPTSAVTRVLVTLDATAEAVVRTSRSGANVLVTHHPPFLDAPPTLGAAPGPAGTLEAALRLGVAVISLHTNLDRSPEGATALAEKLGLTPVAPLESSAERVSIIVTYAPAEAIDGLREAMSQAGAGRIGRYERCAFTSEGTGHFSPLEGARPVVEDPGPGVAETRLEMVAPLRDAARVLAAAREAHPYEEPVLLALDGTRARGAARMGRICTWPESGTLGQFAQHAARVFGSACRVWGDPERPAGRIAVGNGSVGSLVPDAIASADTLLGGEVRYHDALAAAASGLALIEAGHDVTEWPLVGVLERALRDWNAEVPVVAERPAPGWWTMEGADVGR